MILYKLIKIYKEKYSLRTLTHSICFNWQLLIDTLMDIALYMMSTSFQLVQKLCKHRKNHSKETSKWQ